MAKKIIMRGSIVLIRYPFTDLSSSKVRPALIITPNKLLSNVDDILCLFVSSSISTELLETDFILERTHPSFSKTGLRFRSIFRSHKLALLHKSLVLRVLGEMDNDLMKEINQRLTIAIGLKQH